MAARPKRRADFEHLAKHEEQILAEVISGEPTLRLAPKYNVSRRAFYQWLHETKERWERYSEARRMSADAYAEKSREILEEVWRGERRITSSADAKIATALSDKYAWMAQSAERGTYSQAPQVNVGINAAIISKEELQLVWVSALREAALEGGALALPPAEGED